MGEAISQAPSGRLPKLTQACPDVDLNDTVAVLSLYQDSGLISTAQTSQELDARLVEAYGTADYLNATQQWQADPTSIFDGQWGFSHAAQSLSELEVMRTSGSPVSDIQTRGDELTAYWYSREAVSRCSDGISDWMNPLNWSEDSRLDYVAPRLFIEWYMGEIQ